MRTRDAIILLASTGAILVLSLGGPARAAEGTFLKMSAHQCYWKTDSYIEGTVEMTSASVSNVSSDYSLSLFCPISIIDGYDHSGDEMGFGISEMEDEPDVLVYDGSGTLAVSANIVQHDAGATGSYSICGSTSTSTTGRGWSVLHPSPCSSAYELVTIDVYLPSQDFGFAASKMRGIEIANVL